MYRLLFKLEIKKVKFNLIFFFLLELDEGIMKKDLYVIVLH